jgi:hypothetical protein
MIRTSVPLMIAAIAARALARESPTRQPDVAFDDLRAAPAGHAHVRAG